MLNSDQRIKGARAAAAIATSALFTLAGCGGLGDGDKQVCDVAARNDARGVYGVASLAEDEDIARQAGRIKPGSTDANDTSAMQEIVKLCKDKGYEPGGA